MKKLFLLTCSLCLILFAQAQTTVTTTAGHLRADLITAAGGESNLITITQLKINGTLNAQDFTDVKAGVGNMQISRAGLTHLDLSGVTAIGNNEIPYQAFYQFRGLVDLKLPTGGVITTIGESAFSGCTSLTAIDIPEGVTTIADYAFYGDSKVVTLKLPSTLKTIGAGAFRTFTALEQLTLPEGLTSIGAMAFYGMNVNTTITEITIPASVEYIGKEAFALALYNKKVTFASPRNGKALAIGGGAFRSSFYYATEPVTFEFPENTSIFFQEKGVDDGIFNQMFRACTALKEVRNLPSGITQIDNYAFSGTAIESFIAPDGVTVIGTNVFRDAAHLKSVVLPNSVTSIGNFAFYNDAALTSVELGNSVQSIGASAFKGAAALETLELPATVTAIGESAFENMAALKALVVNNPEPIIFSTQKKVFAGIDKENCILYVPAGKVNDYKDFDYWSDFTNIREIGSDAVEQEIENFEDITVEKGIEPVTLNATATGDRPVTYTIETGKEAVATLQGNVLTIVGEGTAQITAGVEGDNDYQAAEKIVTLTVVDYAWLEEVGIAVFGNTVKVVGPDAATSFNKIYVNDTEGSDLTDKTGEISLKATTADGAEVIKLKINKQ